jgi:hypothetical protein
VPRRKRDIVDVRSLARAYTESAMLRIEGLAQKAASETVRLEANRVLLDRGWGKAAQEIVHTGTGANGAHEIIIRHINEGVKAPKR